MSPNTAGTDTGTSGENHNERREPYDRDRLDRLARELYSVRYEEFLTRLFPLLDSWRRKLNPARGPARFSERDVLLITYGDQFRPVDGSALHGLERFAESYLKEIVSWIHILPFFPFTSDDGFSVTDYRRVDPALGDWKPIERMSRTFRMAFDLVLNHTSASHRWFQGFLRQEDRYREFYHHRSADYDSSRVARPRTHPLLTPFTMVDGSVRHVWTTFSADQVDLNYEKPEVMLEMIDTLLYYVERGASMIRLDAVAYLWKEDGTSCIHLRRTHLAVKLFRAVVEYLGLDTVILTETNVPHEENVSYFGNGNDEAHMVYNFALPPLTLQAFIDGTAEHLRRWAATLPERSEHTTFLNFLASHDGIGVTPAAEWLAQEEFDRIVRTVQDRGGLVSRKSTPEGEIPYELNVSWFNAVADSSLPEELRIRAFLSSHTIMMALAGVPCVYVHSLIGSQNWNEGPEGQGHHRAINREKPELDRITKELATEGSRRNRIFNGMRTIIGARRREPCFSPTSSQRILSATSEVFAVVRRVPEGSSCNPGRTVLCLANTAPNDVKYRAAGVELPPRMRDLITGRTVSPGRNGTIALEPYETLWLEVSP